MGRPSLYTVEIGEQICGRLAEGKVSLLTICADLELNYSTVMKWVSDFPEFQEKYARAREIGNDADFEDIVDTASTPPPTVKGFTDAGWVAWNKNLVEAKKWSLSKRNPRKYGDKLDLNMAGSLNVTSLSDEELAAKLALHGVAVESEK
jgi:hypothetical protein